MRHSIFMAAVLTLALGAGLPAIAVAQSSSDSRSSSSSGSGDYDRDRSGSRSRSRSDGLIDATRPRAILSVAKGYGTAKIGRTKKGKPKITGRLAGFKYGVYFYGCNKQHTGCKNIQFAAYFTGVSGLSEYKINDWNRRYRFGKAYLDKDGDPFITMNVNLFGGVTTKNLDDTWDWWRTVVKQFEKFIK